MAKILSIDNMLEAADKLDLPNYERFVILLEAAAHSLAEALAKHKGLVVGGTSWEGEAMGGLCSSFYPARPTQKCPAAIHRGDPDGDWHVNEGVNRPLPRSYEIQHEFDFEPTYVCPLDEGQKQSYDVEREVCIGKGFQYELRAVLASTIAEFLSRTEDSH